MTAYHVTTSEEWRQIPESDCSVSSQGQVRNDTTGRVYRSTLNRGYPQICIRVGGQTRCFRVHRLVAFAFLGEAPEGRSLVNHIDSNKANNRIENLEYVNAKENGQHAAIAGRYHTSDQIAARFNPASHPRGEAHGRAKLTAEDVRQIRVLYSTGHWTYKQLAKRFGVSTGPIALIMYGKIWRDVA